MEKEGVYIESFYNRFIRCAIVDWVETITRRSISNHIWTEDVKGVGTTMEVITRITYFRAEDDNDAA